MKFLSAILLASCAISSPLFAQYQGSRPSVRAQRHRQVDPYTNARRIAVQRLVEAQKNYNATKIRLADLEHTRVDILRDKDLLFSRRDRLEHAITHSKSLIADLEVRDHELHDEIEVLESRRRRRGRRSDLKQIVSVFERLAFGHDRRHRHGDRRCRLRALRRDLADTEHRLADEKARYDELCDRIIGLRRACAERLEDLNRLDRRISRLQCRCDRSELALSRAKDELRRTSRALANRKRGYGHRQPVTRVNRRSGRRQSRHNRTFSRR
ncbi:MAG: hypothetical protein V3W41_12455 [Planctomycetota bacterium]